MNLTRNRHVSLVVKQARNVPILTLSCQGVDIISTQCFPVDRPIDTDSTGADIHNGIDRSYCLWRLITNLLLFVR